MAFDDDNIDGIGDSHNEITDTDGDLVLPNDDGDNWVENAYRAGVGDTNPEAGLGELGFSVTDAGGRVIGEDDAELDGFGTEEETYV